MISVSKIISTSTDEFNRLSVKVLLMGKLIAGKGDIRTPLQAAPYGVDSNPVAQKVAIYTPSSKVGKYYTIGILNTNCQSLPGEIRIFSTDEQENPQTYIWLRNQGNIMELGGDQNFAVRYNELKIEYDKTKAYAAALKTATQAMATALDALIPGTSTAFIAAMAGQVLGDFSQAKNDKIKTV